MYELSLMALLAPLCGALLAAFFGKSLGKWFTNTVTIIGVLVSLALSTLLLQILIHDPSQVLNQSIYTWMTIGELKFELGFLIDNLTASMMFVVSFISLMVHIYTIGYMKNDPGYHRFFTYISLFTFSMLSLLMANNFLQLFFGWEAVGVMSYLLIGFWYTKPSAIKANFKAFIINRVGDFSLLLGIALLFVNLGTLDYILIFNEAETLSNIPITNSSSSNISTITLSCLLLFGGAMGKSAQMPLHVWLPDSMEGPTPISALIHAATMVTAGVFMLARMSPLFELSTSALSFVLIIGATTALFTGFLGLVQTDIKRVIAYSTLSQLGYMIVAAGVSAYSASLFHLMTHAFFKALLFLTAGSVIVALHHQQDIRKMGGLYRYLPYTYITSVIGTLALIGFPGFSGFFSKDALIEAVHHSNIIGSDYAYVAVLIGVFVTALYSFRLLFIVFHGEDKFKGQEIKEPSLSIVVPLILLAIPSVLIAWPTIGPMVFGDFFINSITQPSANDLFGFEFTTPISFLIHALESPVVYIALLGFITALYLYIIKPELTQKISNFFKPIHTILLEKYYFDYLIEQGFGQLFKKIGNEFWRIGDIRIIDHGLVNGIGRNIQKFSSELRKIQSGYIYHYAFIMILSLSLFLGWIIYISIEKT